MRPIHVTGPLFGRHPRAIGPDASSYPSRASLLVGLIAIALVVASFGVLSIPCAAVAMLLGSRARCELRDDSRLGARGLAAIAWWISVAMSRSLIAIVLLLLDLTGIANRALERAR
jgi:hypothetical protein